MGFAEIFMAISQQGKQNLANFWNKVHNISRGKYTLERRGKVNAVLRIRHDYPGSWFISIPDPESNNNKREGAKNCSLFVATHFTNLKIILFLNRSRKKF
jgi:hypothetical protein